MPEIPRGYRGPARVDDGVVDRFCERVAEYQATVTRVAAAELAEHGARAVPRARRARIAVPPGGPDALAASRSSSTIRRCRPQALDGLDGVLTGCALAIAETGTIVLDGGERSGRRALTLVPDWHICIVEASSVVAGVPGRGRRAGAVPPPRAARSRSCPARPPPPTSSSTASRASTAPGRSTW